MRLSLCPIAAGCHSTRSLPSPTAASVGSVEAILASRSGRSQRPKHPAQLAPPGNIVAHTVTAAPQGDASHSAANASQVVAAQWVTSVLQVNAGDTGCLPTELPSVLKAQPQARATAQHPLLPLSLRHHCVPSE